MLLGQHHLLLRIQRKRVRNVHSARILLLQLAIILLLFLDQFDEHLLAVLISLGIVPSIDVATFTTTRHLYATLNLLQYILLLIGTRCLIQFQRRIHRVPLD